MIMGKKKQKVTYVDDGRTLADMSGVTGGMRLGKRDKVRTRPDAKDVWSTYWNAVKMMFGPMLVFIVCMAVVYMIVYFLFSVM